MSSLPPLLMSPAPVNKPHAQPILPTLVYQRTLHSFGTVVLGPGYTPGGAYTGTAGGMATGGGGLVALGGGELIALGGGEVMGGGGGEEAAARGGGEGGSLGGATRQ